MNYYDKTVSVTLKIPEIFYEKIESLFPKNVLDNTHENNKICILESILKNYLRRTFEEQRQFYFDMKAIVRKRSKTDFIINNKVNDYV